MTKHIFVAVLVYTLVYVSSAPLSSVVPLRYTDSNTDYEEVQELDYETAMILSILSDNVLINYVQIQIAGNTPYNWDDATDASFEIFDVEDSDYDDDDTYKIWVIYDVDEVDEQDDNYNDDENVNDGLYFADATTY